MHGRHRGYRNNYLYGNEELKPWINKVNEIKNKTRVLRVYFNNHYGGQAVANALQFRRMVGEELSNQQGRAIEKAEGYVSRFKEQQKLD